MIKILKNKKKKYKKWRNPYNKIQKNKKKFFFNYKNFYWTKNRKVERNQAIRGPKNTKKIFKKILCEKIYRLSMSTCVVFGLPLFSTYRNLHCHSPSLCSISAWAIPSSRSPFTWNSTRIRCSPSFSYLWCATWRRRPREVSSPNPAIEAPKMSWQRPSSRTSARALELVIRNDKNNQLTHLLKIVCGESWAKNSWANK